MQEKVIDQAFVIFFFRGRATGKGKKRRRHTVPHDLRLKRSCSLKIPPSPLLLIVGKRPKILGQFTNKTAKTSYRVKSKTDSTAMRLYQYNLYQVFNIISQLYSQVVSRVADLTVTHAWQINSLVAPQDTQTHNSLWKLNYKRARLSS